MTNVENESPDNAELQLIESEGFWLECAERLCQTDLNTPEHQTAFHDYILSVYAVYSCVIGDENWHKEDKATLFNGIYNEGILTFDTSALPLERSYDEWCDQLRFTASSVDSAPDSYLIPTPLDLARLVMAGEISLHFSSDDE